MICRIISWFICTLVAVALATGYSGQDSNTDSSTAEPGRKVRPIAAVDLGALLDAGEGAVVVLVAGDTRLAAHRAVLSARSAVFQRLLQDAATGEVAVPDVEGPVLRQLLVYLYTLQANQLPAMAPQLLAAAHQYGLPALKADCEQQVAKQLTVETAAATAVLAIKHSCDSLRQAAIGYIRAHIFQVMGTQGWMDAMKNQPEVMSNVAQLLSASPAETSSPAPGGSGASPYATTQPQSDLSSHSDHQTTATVTPIVPAQTITITVDEYISLLRNLSAEERNRRLIEAAKQGAVGQLDALLAAGADVEAAESWNMWTPLLYAADRGHEEAVRRLLAAGAAVDAGGNWKQTPLHWAALRGHAAVVRLLLAAGAAPNARTVFGMTPLHWAAGNGHIEAAAALLEAGADRAARSREGETPLDKARQNNDQQMVDLLLGS